MMWSTDPQRLALAAGLSLSYLLVCLAPLLRARRKRRAARDTASAGAAPWIVAYASQTGNAEELAGQTAQILELAGVPARLCALDALTAADLQRSERVLLLVSTYGEGDAPDNGAAFAGRLMAADLPLAHLHYAVLALGDSAYAQFCGFGRALDQWLERQGAARLFARIEVDRSAAGAIDSWRRQLSHLAGTSDAPDWAAPAFAGWRLAARRLLNPGSAGAPLYHIELEAPDGVLPDWQSGDLAQVAPPGDAQRPRDYSVASLAEDGRVHLLVRLHAQGLASGWLGREAALGALVQMRLRPHRRFRLDGNHERPLILIGNGSGIAGLRAHLKARARDGKLRNWLIFGERNLSHDYHYREEIEHWRDGGVLTRLDLVFSRDQARRLYVQDRLAERAGALRDWVEQGAAIYVCGSLNGMAGGVDLALEQVLGRPALDALAAAGRYRRDVY